MTLTPRLSAATHVTTLSPASLLIPAIVIVVGVLLIVFRRRLARTLERLWAASQRPGSGPAIPTNAAFFIAAGAALIFGAALSVIWALVRSGIT